MKSFFFIDFITYFFCIHFNDYEENISNTKINKNDI